MNPLMASVFYKAGLIENWGRGTINIINDCADYGIPEPEFRFDMNIFWAILYKVTDKVTDNQMKIIECIIDNNSITTNQLADKVGISQRKIKDNINKLKNRNIIKRIGPAKGGYWKVINK